MMNKLNPLIFITPFIALCLVVFLYFILSKKTENKILFKHYVVIIFALAFIFNFVWEVLQMPLYMGGSLNIAHVAFCALASVADAIMVLLIYFCFALIYKNPLWFQNLTLPRILLLMFTGAIGAILAEIRHLSAGNWSYNTSMPILPIVDVGLSPVLQFMLLPPLIYYLSYRMKKDRSNQKSN